MKILCLNIWGGKRWEDLDPFLKKHAVDTDIFCFQEVTSSNVHIEMGEIGMAGNPRFSDVYEMLAGVLTNYQGYFGRELRNMLGAPENAQIHYGSAVFVRDGLSHEYDEAFAYGDEEDRSAQKKVFDLSSRIVQSVTFGQQLAVHHLHGVWVSKDKSDIPGRIEQSEKINQIMARYNMPQVLCGDLNLKPDNVSLRMLTEGRRNLIDEYGVKTTRPHHAPEAGTGFCDYAIVTPDIHVANFEVLDNVVSDHLPLVLRVDLAK